MEKRNKSRHRTWTEGPYFQDILDQPRALRETVVGLDGSVAPAALLRRMNGRVILTGMGSSLHALWPLHLRLLASGHLSFHVETSELLHRQRVLLERAEVIIAVSQSGASAEILHLLGARPSGARLVAVTNTVDSPLATLADDLVLTHAGVEATVSCKTYVATLAALEGLGAGLTGADPGVWDDLRHTADAMETWLGRMRQAVSEIGNLVDGVGPVFLAGRGNSLATVWTGALISKEASRTAVEGMSSASFRHGPLEMVGEQTLLFMVGGEGAERTLNRRLLEDVRLAGGRAEWVGHDADREALRLPVIPEAGRVLMEILPFQALSVALAAREGREAGKFARATKVTTVE
jgi:glucosamine--fructose-6-phosphate aminotransferase (isomerizing)